MSNNKEDLIYKHYFVIGFSLIKYHYDNHKHTMQENERSSIQRLIIRLKSVLRKHYTPTDILSVNVIFQTLLDAFDPKLCFDMFITGCTLIGEIPSDYKTMTPYIVRKITEVMEWYDKEPNAEYYHNQMFTFQMNLTRRVENPDCEVLSADEYNKRMLEKIRKIRCQ